jgi:hypothetical protein
MVDFRITLTDRKHYSRYIRKITILGLINSTILIGIYIIKCGFHSVTIIGIILFSFLIALRFYMNRIYFIEPFFMIKDNIINYRIREFGFPIIIKCKDISRITIGDLIEIINVNDDLIKINLGFIPEKFEIEIKRQMTKLAKELNINLH